MRIVILIVMALWACARKPEVTGAVAAAPEAVAAQEYNVEAAAAPEAIPAENP